MKNLRENVISHCANGKSVLRYHVRDDVGQRRWADREHRSVWKISADPHFRSGTDGNRISGVPSGIAGIPGSEAGGQVICGL